MRVACQNVFVGSESALFTVKVIDWILRYDVIQNEIVSWLGCQLRKRMRSRMFSYRKRSYTSRATSRQELLLPQQRLYPRRQAAQQRRLRCQGDSAWFIVQRLSSVCIAAGSAASLKLTRLGPSRKISRKSTRIKIPESEYTNRNYHTTNLTSKQRSVFLRTSSALTIWLLSLLYTRSHFQTPEIRIRGIQWGLVLGCIEADLSK